MKRLSIIALAIISTMILIAECALAVLYEGTYEGRVIDADTDQPLEGVVVLGVWNTVTVSAAGGTHAYYDAKETLTDKNGEFRIKGLGLKMLSNVEPMNVQIFKAGFEDYGLGPWEGLKVGYYWGKRVKWQGDKAIIPLRKLPSEERKQHGTPSRPNIPDDKMKLMTKEINKDRIERGLDPL